MAGYSGTPLVAKLGIKSGFNIVLVHAPQGFDRTLGALPAGVTVGEHAAGGLDVALLFTNSRAELESEFGALARRIRRAGMLWVAWHKKASKRPTELDENIVRQVGLAAGWVDVKVCAVDEIWSGLKFVRRVSDRALVVE